MDDQQLTAALTPPGVTWGVCVLDTGTGHVVTSRGADTPLSTASVGKLLLLLATSEQLSAGTLDPDELLDRRAVHPVADSGIWQHLATDELPVVDVAALVGAVSDNLASNVLLERVGLGAVDVVAAERLGLRHTALHGPVRDERGPDDPPRLSTGTARELAGLVARIATDDVGMPGIGAQVSRWLRNGCDLSMVAAAFRLDPLAHVEEDRGIALLNKSGTDTGVRADVGVVSGQRRELAYAVVANWTPMSATDPARDAVLATMRHVGELLSTALA